MKNVLCVVLDRHPMRRERSSRLQHSDSACSGTHMNHMGTTCNGTGGMYCTFRGWVPRPGEQVEDRHVPPPSPF
jgi:hypothetical protein